VGPAQQGEGALSEAIDGCRQIVRQGRAVTRLPVEGLRWRGLAEEWLVRRIEAGWLKYSRAHKAVSQMLLSPRPRAG
jgi:hypothetical protein